MPDFELRRKVAKKRGWIDLYEPPSEATGTLSGKNPNGIRIIPVPEWECDLGAAGDLWAEMVWEGVLPRATERKSGCYLGFDGDGEGRLHWETVDEAEVPDPKERLARAITLLWAAWRGAKA